MNWRREPWRRSVVYGLLEGGLFLGLVGGIVWLSLTMQSARRALDARAQQAAQALSGAGALAKLQDELDARQAALQQIARLAPNERAIGEVVAAMEREAARQDVALHVPLVESVDETGAGQAPGIFRDVHLQLIVSGEPTKVVSFFHAAEHLPYLVRVGAWKLITKEEQSPLEAVAAVPDDELPAAAGEVGRPNGAELTMEVFLSLISGERDEAES